MSDCTPCDRDPDRCAVHLEPLNVCRAIDVLDGRQDTQVSLLQQKLDEARSRITFLEQTVQELVHEHNEDTKELEARRLQVKAWTRACQGAEQRVEDTNLTRWMDAEVRLAKLEAATREYVAVVTEQAQEIRWQNDFRTSLLRLDGSDAGRALAALLNASPSKEQSNE